jgi:diguanylate cyclase (GGDEF)-like protein
MTSIEQLSELVELSRLDENIIAQHREPLLKALTEWTPEFTSWLHTKTSCSENSPELLMDGYFESFVCARYDQTFYAIQYQQALHWLAQGIAPSQAIGSLSQIRQFFIHLAESWQQMDLARSLCRVVDLSQSIQATVAHLEHTLEKLRQSAQQDINRIRRSCSVLGNTDQDDIVKAYIAHYRWKVRAYSLALGEPLQQEEVPISPHECELGRWLDKGGIRRFPEDVQEGLLAAHERLHHLMAIILDKAKTQQPQDISHYLMDLEAASEEMATILGNCIEQEVYQLAVEDNLTRLGNRRMFDRELARRISHSQRHNSGFGLLFMDLDNFKTINDRYGHSIGDLVLKSVAQVLQAMMRGGDTVFRWGGEEFGALIHADNIEEVGQLAERLRAKVAETPIQTDLEPIGVTLSIGATLYSPSEERSDGMFRRADSHLNNAKAQGRNRVIVG